MEFKVFFYTFTVQKVKTDFTHTHVLKNGEQAPN